MFQNNVLETALEKAANGNVVQVAMLLALIDGYLNGSIPKDDFLNDIQAYCGVERE